jgi:hypothetical protein
MRLILTLRVLQDRKAWKRCFKVSQWNRPKPRLFCTLQTITRTSQTTIRSERKFEHLGSIALVARMQTDSQFHSTFSLINLLHRFCSRLLDYPGPEKEQAKAMLRELRSRKSRGSRSVIHTRSKGPVQDTFEFSP